MLTLNDNVVSLWRLKVVWDDVDGEHHENPYSTEEEAKVLCTDELEMRGIPYTIVPIDVSGHEWIEGKEYPTRELALEAYEAGYDNYDSAKAQVERADLVFVLLAQEGMIDETTIAENANVFVMWDENWTGKQGMIVRDPDNLQLYKSIHDVGPGQNTQPSKTPAMWTRIADPGEEWPEWIAPIGAHDAYIKGAKVRHPSKEDELMHKWVNTHGDGNVWEPGVFGWNDEGVYEDG